jgi:hypothetical protein
MIVVSYGAGTNSTALLVGMKENNETPDLILFADTGGERPSTYKYIELMQIWLKSIGFPEITVVKKVDKNGDILTLEQNCINKKMIPSVAYGYKTCSQKYKIAPQDKFMNNYYPAKEVWKRGDKITKLIGFDAGEPQRALIDYSCKKYGYRHPLIEWNWGREECKEAILRAGLPQAGKSACFFCPNSNPSEIKELNAIHPELMERCIKMEQNAELTTIKGLGRGHFSWENLVKTNDMFEYPSVDQPCGCYDGEED